MAVIASALLAAFHLLWLVARFGGESGITTFSDLIQILPPLAAMWACARRARRTERGSGRLAWWLLAASQASWALGTMTWSIYEVGLGVDVPFPSLADLGFLITVPLAAAGVLAFPGAPRKIYSRMRTLMDGMIIGGSLLFVSWATVLGPTYRAGADSLLHQILSLAYPLGDVVIVAAVVFVAARAARGARASLVLVGLGVLILGLTDSTFIFLDLRGAYATGSLIDVGWTVGPLMILLGALATSRALGDARTEDDRTAVSTAFLPYVAPALAAITAFVVQRDGGRLDPFLVWNGLAIIAVIVVRQLMTLLENISLNRLLESRVEERTAELRASEERFRSLVQNSSDLIVIVSPDSTVSYASQSVERVLEVPASALMGAALIAKVHREDEPRFMAAFADSLKRPGSPVAVECRMRQGESRWANIELKLTNLLHDVSVRGIVLNGRDVTERRLLEDQLTHQAFHDPLTGLANRAVFSDRVEHALRRGTRFNDPLAVLFLDLDGFKSVNDSLGHAGGDSLLTSFGARLAGWVRPGDTVARLGGDEFAILLEQLSTVDEAATIAERIVEGSRTPFLIEGRELYVRASIGIATHGDAGDTTDLLLRNADVAMYIAKARGKGRYEVFHPDMHAPVLARLETESELRTAIERGDLRLHYQPIVDLHGGGVKSLEALVRWEHPERGLVSPVEFIPVAEESGLIHSIGSWVLTEACGDMQRLHDRLGVTVPVAVNLSAQQFQSPELPALVASTLERSGLAPENLVLEITETTVMTDTEATVSRLRELKELGVRLAIDDFGTGYSSLSYLRRFPVDVLKIDRSFVKDIARSAEESALARAILKLAQTFHLHAVAEGIERREQLDTLRSMGCLYGQGYFFSEPRPLEDLEPMLSRNLLASIA